MMGFTDSDFDKVEGTLIDSALTKQAGNSIVVNVLEAIFTNLFIKKPLS
jgi:DNA (cytosine-5)-methyltransferase 1